MLYMYSVHVYSHCKVVWDFAALEIQLYLMWLCPVPHLGHSHSLLRLGYLYRNACSFVHEFASR